MITRSGNSVAYAMTAQQHCDLIELLWSKLEQKDFDEILILNSLTVCKMGLMIHIQEPEGGEYGIGHVRKNKNHKKRTVSRKTTTVCV